MISQIVIETIINKSLEEVLNSNFDRIKTLNNFIGVNSDLESIEIVQILSFISEELEIRGVVDYDIFEVVFRHESLTFDELIKTILKDVSSSY